MKRKRNRCCGFTKRKQHGKLNRNVCLNQVFPEVITKCIQSYLKPCLQRCLFVSRKKIESFVFPSHKKVHKLLKHQCLYQGNLIHFVFVAHNGDGDFGEAPLWKRKIWILTESKETNKLQTFILPSWCDAYSYLNRYQEMTWEDIALVPHARLHQLRQHIVPVEHHIIGCQSFEGTKAQEIVFLVYFPKETCGQQGHHVNHDPRILEDLIPLTRFSHLKDEGTLYLKRQGKVSQRERGESPWYLFHQT